jgi:cytoskeletal protein RodZ
MKETTPTIIFEQQQERLSKIGAYLQQIRVAKGWTLALMTRRTKIRMTLLNNMESGLLEELPEAVYLKGLIRRYADSLGLDGVAIAHSFPVEDVSHQWKLPTWRNFSFQFQLRPAHLYAIYLLVIVTTVQSLANVVRIPNTALDPELQPTTEEVEAPRQQVTAPVSKPTPIALVKDPLGNAMEGSITIDVATQETAWMRVEVDGKTEFEGILPKGSQKKWVVDESVKIRTGNAGAVIITIDNEPPHPLGEPGAVEEFTYQALAEDEAELPQRSPS